MSQIPALICCFEGTGKVVRAFRRFAAGCISQHSSKMAAIDRQTQQIMARTVKKIEKGYDFFQSMWPKIEAHDPTVRTLVNDFDDNYQDCLLDGH